MHVPLYFAWRNKKMYTAISIKVVQEQSGKVEYERERLLGTALKIH
jgi:hypothetical protein